MPWHARALLIALCNGEWQAPYIHGRDAVEVTGQKITFVVMPAPNLTEYLSMQAEQGCC